MAKSGDAKLLKSIKTGKGFIKVINNLKLDRRINKVKGVSRSRLSKSKRLIILSKTDSHCHICGIKVLENNFQADHVKSHIAGGAHAENNYLPSCFTCNNYRWHY